MPDIIETNSQEAEREILRGILADIESGMNTKNLPKIIRHLNENVIVIYQNAEVSRGITEVTAFYKTQFEGQDSPIKEFSIHAEVAAPAVFYPGAAVAFGTSQDHMTLRNGKVFLLKGRWSTTLIKNNNYWKVTCLHFSTNVLDNCVVDFWKKLTIAAAIAAIVLGIASLTLTFKLLH